MLQCIEKFVESTFQSKLTIDPKNVENKVQAKIEVSLLEVADLVEVEEKEETTVEEEVEEILVAEEMIAGQTNGMAFVKRIIMMRKTLEQRQASVLHLQEVWPCAKLLSFQQPAVCNIYKI